MDKLESKSAWKDTILRYLGVNDDSIAGIMNHLREGGESVHRLVLTGYLNAMVDFGVLKERNVKPARIFVPELSQSRDIYRAVGKIALEVDPENHADASLATLHFLFGRPIFMREIERCDAGLPRNYQPVQSTQRLYYIEKLAEAGVKVPTNNVLIEPAEKGVTQTLHRILRELLLFSFDLRKHQVYAESGKQTTLY
ncbi:MAG: hypothetical protein M1148_03410 [Candidatus Thermoplasmatota archaeon]|nr:hypothetical protein [Candidatus Thermoplasmatota archaeon]MCL5438226.1 hypothetical protein [Candidatus Thermoplasmatota archaeon]